MGVLNDLKNTLLKEGAKAYFRVEDLNDPELTKDRVSICESNVGKCFEDFNRTCLICTCFVDVKSTLKTNKKSLTDSTVVITHCPLGKWRLEVGKPETDKEIANQYNRINNKKEI